jgi:hypothetical protein
MDEIDQITMRMKVTPVPEFLPVVQGFVEQLAGQLKFKESQRLNLKEGVGRACAQMMESGGGASQGEMQLEFNGFPDRLEIVLESGKGGEPAETQAFLLNELLDRVSLEETPEGGRRLMLVKFNEQGRQQ